MVPGDYLALAHIGSCLSALGRYDEAERYFRRSLAGLDDATTHYNVGLLHGHRRDDLDEAEREYRRAMAIDPAQADARGNLATLLVRTGRHAEAVRELRQLVADDPENVVALTNLGVALIEQGRAAEARRYLEEALRLAPGMPQAVEALRAEWRRAVRALASSLEPLASDVCLPGRFPEGRQGLEAKASYGTTVVVLPTASRSPTISSVA